LCNDDDIDDDDDDHDDDNDDQKSNMSDDHECKYLNHDASDAIGDENIR
jgi:hypothetical protein